MNIADKREVNDENNSKSKHSICKSTPIKIQSCEMNLISEKQIPLSENHQLNAFMITFQGGQRRIQNYLDQFN